MGNVRAVLGPPSPGRPTRQCRQSHSADGAILFPAGVLLLEQAGVRYLDKAGSLPLFFAALTLLGLFGVAAFRIARRREYPWLLALAAVALPLFDPTQAPYHGGFRVLVGARDVVLIGATVVLVAQSIQSGDELERRIHKVIMCNIPNVLGNCCREEECLSLFWQSHNNFIDVLFESHIEHDVCFIEDKECN